MPHATTLPLRTDAPQSQPNRAWCQVKKERRAAAIARILSFINMCEFRQSSPQDAGPFFCSAHDLGFPQCT
jgi:hypothetical protein